MKRYDRAYFDRWYRARARVTGSPAALRRVVRLALAAADYLLERPVRTVLDVGCGEGAWRRELLALRPRLRYVGVDPSPYVVQRFGARRNIRLGSVESLGALGLDGPFDLVVCADVLHYLPDAALTRAAREIAAHTAGVAVLPLFTSDDEFDGDRTGWQRRSAAAYRRVFRRAGLVPCGLHCYASATIADRVAALEGCGR